MYGWRLYVRYLCCAAFGASITLWWTGPHVDWVNSAIGTVIVVALGVSTVGSAKVNSWQTPHTWLRDHTLCRWGHHCAPHKRIQKFDGGKLPQLCCYCRLIVAWGMLPAKEKKDRELLQTVVDAVQPSWQCKAWRQSPSGQFSYCQRLRFWPHRWHVDYRNFRWKEQETR